jgi:hypothetical protein
LRVEGELVDMALSSVNNARRWFPFIGKDVNGATTVVCHEKRATLIDPDAGYEERDVTGEKSLAALSSRPVTFHLPPVGMQRVVTNVQIVVGIQRKGVGRAAWIDQSRRLGLPGPIDGHVAGREIGGPARIGDVNCAV